MFVGEAPGRLGADRTAIPFHGDAAGDNFERLLRLAGLSRREIFVTNAVLCNPKDTSGNNAPPSKQTVKNCAENLRQQIAVVQPKVVVTLGAVALEATRYIEEHDLSLSRNVRTANDWNGVKLVPLYHPGARAMIHRNFAAQTADYYFVGEIISRIGRGARLNKPKSDGDSLSWKLVKYIIYTLKELSLFRLHKIIYLVDWYSIKNSGFQLSNFIYIRQKDGPYCVELGSRWFKIFERDIKTFMRERKLYLAWSDSGLFSEAPSLPDDMRRLIDNVTSDTEGLSDSMLKTRVYLTDPMKRSLKAERVGSRQLNKPLL